MTNQFKNRLVGTVILVALGVIFIPNVLDGKKTRVSEEFNAIPFAPEVKDQPPLLIELESQDSGGLAEVREEAESLASVETEPEPEKTPTAASFEKPAYVIQLGTFKNAANVERLVSKLREEGYQAHSYPSPAKDGELNRVFVGPNVSKQTLESQQKAIQSITGLGGKIRQFDPLFGKG